MKHNYLLYLAIAIITAASCSKMNDNIDQYLSKGEIIYIAKPDTVKLYPGKERFKMEFWMRDPRATEMRLYWSQRTDSLIIKIPEGRDFDNPITVMVDKNIAEGNYTLNLVTFDAYGNKSVPDEENVNVYGENFQNSLFNRYVDSQSFSGNKLTINWGNCYSSKEIGIRIWYTDVAGTAKEVTFKTEEIGTSSVLNSVDGTRSVEYSTMYIPEPEAIDTFFTAKTVIPF